MSILKPRVLLLTPPRFYPYLMPMQQYSEGLLYIKAYLKDVAIVDIRNLEVELGIPDSKKQVERTLLSISGLFSRMPHYDYVGVSCYTTYHFSSTIAISKLIQQTWPNARIIVGGYHPTAVPDDFIYEDSPFDFIVRGEGEEAMREIVQGEIQAGDSPQVIVGRQLSGEELPDISFEDLNYRTAKTMFSLSRGCAMKCAYCCQSGHIASKWRSISASRAIDCVKRAYEVVGKKVIFFTDQYFGLKKGWLVEFLEGLISMNLPVVYRAECRADQLTDDVMDLMSELDFKVMFGIESLSPWTLRIMNKARNPEAYVDASLRTISRCFQKDIPCELFFLVNHPGETAESFNETITRFGTFIKSFEQVSCFLKLHPFQLFPGNYVYDNLEEYVEKYGFVIERADWWRTGASDMAGRCVSSSSIGQKYGYWPGYWRQAWGALRIEAWKRMSLRSYKLHFTELLDDFPYSNYGWDSKRAELCAKIVMAVHKACEEAYIGYDIMLRNCNGLLTTVGRISEKDRQRCIEAVFHACGGSSQTDTEILEQVSAMCSELLETNKMEMEQNGRALMEVDKKDTLCFEINHKKYEWENIEVPSPVRPLEYVKGR